MTTVFDVPGSSPSNPFTTPIQALFAFKISSTPTPTLEETASDIVSSVTKSLDPASSLWMLWDAYFTAVVESSISHELHIALLDVLRVQPPTQPNNLPSSSDEKRRLRSYTGSDNQIIWQELPRFSAQWRDVHDILESWRDWDGVRESHAEYNTNASSNTNGGDKYFLRFCSFSAALLRAAKDKSEVHPVNVFYACRKGLESHRPQSVQTKAHRTTPQQTWALDVRVAAIWMRDGGRALWELDHDELRRHWSVALNDQTELWLREDGLTQERWQLWADRLKWLTTDEAGLDEETRTVVAEAAGVVSRLLEKKRRLETTT